jgi:hypothetical protein
MAEEFPSTSKSGESHPIGDGNSQSGESSRHSPLPLPYEFPLAQPEERGVPNNVSNNRDVLLPASGIYPKVPEDRWVKQEESILQKRYTHITGQHPVPRPKTLPLKPPRRFRQVAHWQSITMLSIVIVLAVVACFGLLQLGVGGASLLHPGPAPAATPSRIASPTRKSH